MMIFTGIPWLIAGYRLDQRYVLTYLLLSAEIEIEQICHLEDVTGERMCEECIAGFNVEEPSAFWSCFYFRSFLFRFNQLHL